MSMQMRRGASAATEDNDLLSCMNRAAPWQVVCVASASTEACWQILVGGPEEHGRCMSTRADTNNDEVNAVICMTCLHSKWKV